MARRRVARSGEQTSGSALMRPKMHLTAKQDARAPPSGNYAADGFMTPGCGV